MIYVAVQTCEKTDPENPGFKITQLAFNAEDDQSAIQKVLEDWVVPTTYLIHRLEIVDGVLEKLVGVAKVVDGNVQVVTYD